MDYKEVEDLLPRNPEKGLAPVLKNLSELIDKVINFGTHLMKWDAEKFRTGDESVPTMLFFRNIIELGDAIAILVKQSSIDPCKPLLRSLIENMFGLLYMVEKDTNQRALSYIVWNTHKNLNSYNKLLTSTQSGKQFKKEIEKDKLIKGTIDIFDKPMITNLILNAENYLKLPKFSSIETEYQKASLKLKNPPWYALFGGPENIEKLAKYLELHGIYEIFYRSYSGNVHATSVMQGKLIPNKDGSIGIVQIRYPEDAQSITQATINTLRMAYEGFYKDRIPEKKTVFQSWNQELSKLTANLLDRRLINIVT